MPLAVPWESSAVASAASSDLSFLSIGEPQGAKLVASDVLAWQKVSDGRQILELAVAWLHFRFSAGAECWGIVEVFRFADHYSWRPANDWTSEGTWWTERESADIDEYTRALVPLDEKRRISLQCDVAHKRCLVVDSRPTSEMMHIFLVGCCFYEPWFESRREAWDVVQDRIINYSAWMKCLGTEPSPEVMESLGKCRVL